MKKHRNVFILASRGLFLFILAISFPFLAKSQNLRQLTTADGLASSAVLSVHQSNDGMLWLGTLDGVNIYYGASVVRASMIEYGSLEGHIIENIIETPGNNMWIQTAYGLHKLTRLSREVVCFPRFTGNYKISLAGGDRILLLDKEEKIQVYLPETDAFKPVDYPLEKGEEILELGGTMDYCWVAGNKGVFRYNWKDMQASAVSLGSAVHLLDTPVKYCKASDKPEILYAVDDKDCLYKLDIRRNERTYIMDLGHERAERGEISKVVEMNATFYISFKVGGVVKYESTPSSKEWIKTDLGIKSGVFGMVKDRFQDLLWIATDGQGVFSYWEGVYQIRSYRFDDFSYNLGKPVRALYKDKNGWLWIGTKGEGLLGINRNDTKLELYKCPQRLLTTRNSKLKDNSVYALARSVYDGFWVGSEGGLNFYDSGNGSLQEVGGTEGIEYIHAIQEVGDSVLWMATVGMGVFKARIVKRGNGLSLDEIHRFDVDNGVFSSNYFFAMHYTEEGDLWLGNRGHGVFKMHSDGMSPTAIPNKQRSPLQNEVFALCKSKDVLWVGTSCGLIGYGDDGREWSLDESDGLPNNIIHSMELNEDNGLWVATNDGIACVSSDFDEIKSFGRKDGLQVTEFSDGASMHTDNTVYFGAVDGWVEIERNHLFKATDTYIPPLYFIAMQGLNESVSLHLLKLNEKREAAKVEMKRDESNFSVSFMVMDYMNLGDYRYYYRLNGEHDGPWIDNGTANSVSFAQLQPGNYQLQVKYRNNATGYESEPITLAVEINPYWWQEPIMILFYWLLFFGGIAYFFIAKYRKVKRRHAYALETINRRHREEVYEEKLRFFTNITHEFSTPLTLIYTPCERILSYEGTDDFVRKYVLLIKKHTERLYALIQEIIDYRRIETKHQQLRIERYNISEYVHESCSVFADMAEKLGVRIVKDVEENIYWNMDRRCLPKIMTNLISNALKYTPKEGLVRVTLKKISDEKLQLKVYNTGKGIKEEDKVKIFNRYSILDKVEENVANGMSRNGLGMAICNSSVNLLEGTIDIDSKIGEYAEFIVTLPLLPLTKETEEDQPVENVVRLGEQNAEVRENEGETEFSIDEQMEKPEGECPIVLIVDDNPDILYLLRDSLTYMYDVKTAKSAEEALDVIRASVPKLIITDVMMPGTDGVTFARQIKQNKHTMHVPLIILSARSTIEAMTEGVQAGADAYIGKPFNMKYLQAVIARLIESRKVIQEYYTTSACAYDYVEGKLIKQEDKEFLYRLGEVVEEHLANSSFTVEMLADTLHVSVRSLYRKLKELEQPSPKDFIKERKMKKAMTLLQNSDLSIQEIIYECGFNNRAHFYKDFGKWVGLTPKEFRIQHKQKDSSLIE